MLKFNFKDIYSFILTPKYITDLRSAHERGDGGGDYETLYTEENNPLEVWQTPPPERRHRGFRHTFT